MLSTNAHTSKTVAESIIKDPDRNGSISLPKKGIRLSYSYELLRLSNMEKIHMQTTNWGEMAFSIIPLKVTQQNLILHQAKMCTVC